MLLGVGRRVRTTNAEGATRHVYDESCQVIADVAEDGSVLRSYVWGEGVDRLLAVRGGGHTFTALTDVQGTVWGYADERGEVVARWTYDAWGNVLDEEVAASASELRAIRYRFQGREFSAATGLTNFRMRWYDPVTGRWLSKDSIGLNGGLNLYEFCGENPICREDPLGCAPPVIMPGLIIAPGAGPDWHHGGRDCRNSPLPASPPQGGDWWELPKSQNAFHDNGVGSPGRKFVAAKRANLSRRWDRMFRRRRVRSPFLRMARTLHLDRCCEKNFKKRRKRK